MSLYRYNVLAAEIIRVIRVLRGYKCTAALELARFACKEPTFLLKPILLRQKWGGNAPFVVSARFCRNVYVKKC